MALYFQSQLSSFTLLNSKKSRNLSLVLIKHIIVCQFNKLQLAQHKYEVFFSLVMTETITTELNSEFLPKCQPFSVSYNRSRIEDVLLSVQFTFGSEWVVFINIGSLAVMRLTAGCNY